MKEFYYKKNQVALEQLKSDIKKYADQKKYETQDLDDSELGWAFQMRKISGITLGIGSRAVTVKIVDFSNDTVKVS
ncbi:hypothetical protein JCM19047_673 [Bacillus sp. JCM 19047]|nr:hypothetical protein JCM19047_673 [Bacillus sp. JCM 19047]